MAKLTQKQRHDNHAQAVKNLEQEQLIGYWAKTQGFSHKAIEKTDLTTLQALRIASNCLKRKQFLSPEEKQTFHQLLNNFKLGKSINTALLNSVFKKARKIQRQQAKHTRKATR